MPLNNNNNNNNNFIVTIKSETRILYLGGGYIILDRRYESRQMLHVRTHTRTPHTHTHTHIYVCVCVFNAKISHNL